METQTKSLLKFLIVPLLLACFLIVSFSSASEEDWLMTVSFFNVGQGDAALIETYQGQQILIDGGPGDGVVQELGKTLPFYDRDLDMIILTHPHADHLEGLIPVLEKYHVKKIVMPNVSFKSDGYEAFLNSAKSEDTEIIFAVQGQRIYLDNATVLDILYPSTSKTAFPKQSAEVNDSSIVAKLTFGTSKMLFTGDSGTNIEDELIKSFNLDVDLLKVGHHGSKHSTSDRFLKATTPEVAIIQVGKNNYGHPAQDVLDRLKAHNTKVLRNDLSGTIEIQSDGSKLIYKTE